MNKRLEKLDHEVVRIGAQVFSGPLIAPHTQTNTEEDDAEEKII